MTNVTPYGYLKDENDGNYWIIDEVAEKDKIVLVNKNSKPQNIIISYDRCRRLKEQGADI